MIKSDRVRENTSSEINTQIDARTEEQVRRFANAGEAQITQRIDALNREWDIERYLETMASSFSLSGVILGATKSNKWLILPGVVLSFLFQHAVQGWCPPVPVLRRFGVRTRKEIERERYALKLIRGDFRVGPFDSGSERSDAAAEALEAVAR